MTMMMTVRSHYGNFSVSFSLKSCSQLSETKANLISFLSVLLHNKVENVKFVLWFFELI